MYAFIEGIVEHKSSGELVINAGGVGYLLLCSQSTLSAVPPRGEFTRIYTHLSVREDAMELFGFTSQEEKAMFLRLTSISGIGPRTALGVLAAMPLPDLTLAILTGDAAALCRAPGIGKSSSSSSLRSWAPLPPPPKGNKKCKTDSHRHTSEHT